MLNLQQIISQVSKSSNPNMMMNSILGGNSEAMMLINQLQGLPQEQQYQKIADILNEKGVTKQQLENLISGMNR